MVVVGGSEARRDLDFSRTPRAARDAGDEATSIDAEHLAPGDPGATAPRRTRARVRGEPMSKRA
jgi:hypothetical protein